MFVEYHLLLGVNKIIIYDNNDINGEEIIKPLEYYIKKKYVDIIDVRGLSSIQIPIYNFYIIYTKNNWIILVSFFLMVQVKI